MTEPDFSEQIPKSVICLETSIKLWKRLNQALDLESGTSEFMLTRSPEGSTDLVALCRRLAPALFVIEEARIQLLPIKELSDLIGRRDIQILVFSDTTEEAMYEHLFGMGCTGVVPNPVTPETLLEAVRMIFAGELWMPRKVLSRLAHEAFFRGSARKLTRRETDIFKLIRLGLTNQQIADSLFISRETVRWHVRSLYSKIGVDSRGGAIRHGKISQEGTDREMGPSSDGPKLEATGQDAGPRLTGSLT